MHLRLSTVFKMISQVISKSEENDPKIKYLPSVTKTTKNNLKTLKGLETTKNNLKTLKGLETTKNSLKI
jgi:hypothetical protein